MAIVDLRTLSAAKTYTDERQAVKYNSPKKRFPTSVIMELQKHKKQEEGNLWKV